ncbi:MAG: flagellar basal body rod protein FlgC [Deltaproteobacteria bacterium]|nr:flagellar basal body rod protein FlgC [Deltaproteobacteria bacterium]
MDFFDSLDISASGLVAQRVRMNVIASNLANVETTRTAQGGPYRRQDVVFRAVPLSPSFGEAFRHALDGRPSEVEVVDIVTDRRPPKRLYAPSHPDADASGYVAVPNINVIEEMVNMLSATRSYEANVTAIQSAKSMALRALEIAR